MSLDDFIKFLQDILTMIDPDDEDSVERGEQLLNDLVDFAIISRKVDGRTIYIMRMAQVNYGFLVDTRQSFAGTPHNYEQNKAKRRRLLMSLEPHC